MAKVAALGAGPVPGQPVDTCNNGNRRGQVTQIGIIMPKAQSGLAWHLADRNWTNHAGLSRAAEAD